MIKITFANERWRGNQTMHYYVFRFFRRYSSRRFETELKDIARPLIKFGSELRSRRRRFNWESIKSFQFPLCWFLPGMTLPRNICDLSSFLFSAMSVKYKKINGMIELIIKSHKSERIDIGEDVMAGLSVSNKFLFREFPLILKQLITVAHTYQLRICFKIYRVIERTRLCNAFFLTLFLMQCTICEALGLMRARER